jgi:glycine hydroxymethyltransferase
MTTDFLFTGSVADLDPDLQRLLDREDKRQDETLILIPSESMAPDAVREAMSSRFGHIYAEGYPRPESRRQKEADIMDIEAELAYYRRYSDPRYYKGVEIADLLEALARRRAAELFAANGISADNLYVNVQPLSGAPANNAVYSALLNPGDTIMGLNLNDGGHLSHGSSVNRSGKVYKSVPYFVDPQTELLYYEVIRELAVQSRPQIIVAGYSAYPAIVDWAQFRAIANEVGAYLLADISHISGLVATGMHPSPIGIADVVMTTTHKSLCGPRGAMLITHNRALAGKLDRAVFPGEQGGPHLNTMAALAVSLKLAKTDAFKELQQRVVANAARLAAKLQEHGVRVVGGKSETHLLLIDTKSIKENGVHLTGDMAARILDVAGIVTNRNTIPGDVGAFSSTGVRLGTVWISQLGFGEAEIDQLAEAMATLLKGCHPYVYLDVSRKKQIRAKVDFAALQQAKATVRQLRGLSKPTPAGDGVEIRGAEAMAFLNLALSSDVTGLRDGKDAAACMYFPGGGCLNARLKRLSAEQFQLRFEDSKAAVAAAEWLQTLSDGYVLFETENVGGVQAKLPGPIVATNIAAPDVPAPAPSDTVDIQKPYFVGQSLRYKEFRGRALPPFTWEEPAEGPLKKTGLHSTHVSMGAKMVPFGGWDMPVWYSSVSEEHAAVRQTAGLFDVSHMGVLEASGPHALTFLNTVTANDVSTLEIGQSHYTYLLLPDGSVVDDLLVYRRGRDKFMLVVNASNNDKDWAWLKAVNEGAVQIDADRPWVQVEHSCVLRDLRDPQWGDECRVDIALQGPRSTDILLALCNDPALAKRIKALPWAGLTEGNVGGFDLVISRTGYTGERVAYELFVHPDHAPSFWGALMEAGEGFGLKACGLASRDSTRTEAGLPLYGHELAGLLGLNPADAGFVGYVKLWKPFFIGRAAFVTHEAKRDRQVTRFRMNEKGVRRPESGDPVLDRRGKIVGTVTSCAIDAEGYLLGQAVLPLSMIEEGTPVWIYQMGGGTRPLAMPKEVKVGAKLPTPDAATVLSRFPVRKK